MAHSGNSCAIFEPSGAYVGCLRRYLISNADGGTVLVSQMDKMVANTTCPNGSRPLRAFDPVAHQPDFHVPTDAEKRQLGYTVIGGIVSMLLLTATFIIMKTKPEPPVPKI